MAPPLFNNIMGASAKDPNLIPFLNAKMANNAPPSSLQDLASPKNNQSAAIKKRMQNQNNPAQSPNNNPFINMQQQQQQDITNDRKSGY